MVKIIDVYIHKWHHVIALASWFQQSSLKEYILEINKGSRSQFKYNYLLFQKPLGQLIKDTSSNLRLY